DTHTQSPFPWLWKGARRVIGDSHEPFSSVRSGSMHITHTHTHTRTHAHTNLHTHTHTRTHTHTQALSLSLQRDRGRLGLPPKVQRCYLATASLMMSLIVQDQLLAQG